jgi:glycoside/pentoside/hexuronide:cation symporter, GPH family
MAENSAMRSLIYAGPAIVLSMMTFALVVYIPAFYATETGLSLAAVGVAFFAARLWDAFIDPLIGYYSDKTNSRWGRRKPWIAIGVPLLLLTAWWLFVPGDHGGKSVTYLLVSIFLFYVFWTGVQIPYLSLGAELSSDYAERSRIVGFRESAMFVGTILATGVPALVFSSGNPTIGQILELFFQMSLIILPITALLLLWKVPEARQTETHVPTILKTIAALSRNRAFLRLNIAAFLLWLGLHIYNAGVLLVIQHQLKLPTSIFLQLALIQFSVGLVINPLLIRLANRWGKHRALGLAAVLVSLSLPLLALLPTGDKTWAMIMFGLLGITISPIWVLPTALVADAVDLGRFKGGGDQSGMYMAIYNLMVKFALALSVGIALPLMQWLGFNPETGAGSRSLVAVTLLLPAAAFLPAAWLLFTYPLDQRRLAIVQRWLARRPEHGLRVS